MTLDRAKEILSEWESKPEFTRIIYTSNKTKPPFRQEKYYSQSKIKELLEAQQIVMERKVLDRLQPCGNTISGISDKFKKLVQPVYIFKSEDKENGSKDK